VLIQYFDVEQKETQIGGGVLERMCRSASRRFSFVLKSSFQRHIQSQSVRRLL
jgi:hypothetical protein